MKTSSPTDFSDLLLFSQKLVVQSLKEALATDAVDAFPVKTLQAIKEAKLLSACISSKNGGRDMGLISGNNLALLHVLKQIGKGNLVLGRVLEGHMNAQLLINDYGSPLQKKKFAKDALNGKLFGVWNTQADDGTFIHVKNGSYLLNGSKTFATGIDYVSRPIITAKMPDNSWQMCVVPLNKVAATVDKTWWNPMGMKASRSFKISFKDAAIPKENLLGDKDAYYTQPAFSGGAVRFAAVQLGAAELLLEETITYLQNLKRTDDPYQKMRIGEMTIAITSGNQWLEAAARSLDSYMQKSDPENREKLLFCANMSRTAIEKICLQAMELCTKCVGARGLNKPHHFERIIRDLSTYLRQPAPDFSLAEVGRFALENFVNENESKKKTKAKF